MAYNSKHTGQAVDNGVDYGTGIQSGTIPAKKALQDNSGSPFLTKYGGLLVKTANELVANNPHKDNDAAIIIQLKNYSTSAVISTVEFNITSLQAWEDLWDEAARIESSVAANYLNLAGGTLTGQLELPEGTALNAGVKFGSSGWVVYEIPSTSVPPLNSERHLVFQHAGGSRIAMELNYPDANSTDHNYTLTPGTDGGSNLGEEAVRWSKLFIKDYIQNDGDAYFSGTFTLTGVLTDGQNSMTVSDIASQRKDIDGMLSGWREVNVLTIQPAEPHLGDVYYDAGNDTYKRFNGTAWEDITVLTSRPNPATEGDYWLDSGILYNYSRTLRVQFANIAEKDTLSNPIDETYFAGAEITFSPGWKNIPEHVDEIVYQGSKNNYAKILAYLPGDGWSPQDVYLNTPISPIDGDIWYDGGLSVFKRYFLGWYDAEYTTSDNPPVTPEYGDVWYSNIDAKFYVWEQGWVIVPFVTEEPLDPVEGEIWLDASTELFKQYTSGEWVEMDPQPAEEEPSTPTEGEYWLDGPNLKTYISHWGDLKYAIARPENPEAGDYWLNGFLLKIYKKGWEEFTPPTAMPFPAVVGDYWLEDASDVTSLKIYVGTYSDENSGYTWYCDDDQDAIYGDKYWCYVGSPINNFVEVMRGEGKFCFIFKDAHNQQIGDTIYIDTDLERIIKSGYYDDEYPYLTWTEVQYYIVRPAHPKEGDIWFDENLNVFKKYLASGWVVLAVADSKPASPAIGDYWLDGATLMEYNYAPSKCIVFELTDPTVPPIVIPIGDMVTDLKNSLMEEFALKPASFIIPTPITAWEHITEGSANYYQYEFDTRLITPISQSYYQCNISLVKIEDLDLVIACGDEEGDNEAFSTFRIKAMKGSNPNYIIKFKAMTQPTIGINIAVTVQRGE